MEKKQKKEKKMKIETKIKDIKKLVRPFTPLRKGSKAFEKLHHHMPFGNPTLPKLCLVDAKDRFELSGKCYIALKDANGTHFMLTFHDLPRGPWEPARYQAWLLSKTKRKIKKQGM